MKTKLLNKNRIVQGVAVLAMALLCSNAQAQQVIGQFPNMIGGIEAESTTANLPVVSSTGTTQFAKWSIGSSSNAVVQKAYSDGTARTGNIYVSQSLGSGKTSTRLQTPTNPDTNYLLPNTDYIIQFYYRAAVDPTSVPNITMSGTTYLNGVASGSVSSSAGASTATFTANTWIKYAQTLKTTATATATFAQGPGNFAAVRISAVSAADIFTTQVDVDDFVVYAGTVPDVIKPDAATAPTYSKSGNDATIGWTASGAIDGGGYVVVRYPSTSTVYSDNDPNQNGIYQVGNTITNGTGAVTGTVVYIGTGVSATITDPDTAKYYYKIYAVDKAFNYSDEITAKDASLAEPTLRVAKNDIKGLNVYPNPVKDGKLFINTDSGDAKKVAIYNILGKQVLSKEVASGQVDVSSLNKGVYVLKITEAGKTSTRKIVID
ncbi:T9SS type A sorting domain-containing protein [Flavobacterium ovatum]|uniref:T9SS type A sorting domain-containing protein n=1 Tax=Flavobacterium ovatum TaxID=1928857 RepID=UPI00344B39BE